MWWNRVLLITLGFVMAGASFVQACDGQDLEASLSKTVQCFYLWVLNHGEEAQRLEPRIVAVDHTNRLTLDMTTLDKYANSFMESGCFSPEFPTRVASFYQRSMHQLESYSQKEYDQMARDGRGPLIDSEDIDVYFCSQEAEHTASYANAARLTVKEAGAETALAEVVTPDQWKTTFDFRNVGGRWLISGYCLYR